MKKSIFNTRLKSTAKEQGYTQQTLAEKMYVSVETVKKWYTTTMPDLDTVRELANELDVDVAFLLGDIECKHHEEQTIKDVTGLSKESCVNLLRIARNNPEGFAVLDEILSSDDTAEELSNLLSSIWLEMAPLGIANLSIAANKIAELHYLDTWKILRNIMNNMHPKRIFERTVLAKNSDYDSLEDVGNIIEEILNP